MMVSGGVKFRYLGILIGLDVVRVGLAIFLEPFRMARFTAFLAP